MNKEERNGLIKQRRLLREKCKQKDKEIERLNNIINELEKWLKDKQDLTCGCGITVDYLYAYENCLDKLKELKENNKDERNY